MFIIWSKLGVSNKNPLLTLLSCHIDLGTSSEVEKFRCHRWHWIKQIMTKLLYGIKHEEVLKQRWKIWYDMSTWLKNKSKLTIECNYVNFYNSFNEQVISSLDTRLLQPLVNQVKNGMNTIQPV